jgi:hypothetical protein
MKNMFKALVVCTAVMTSAAPALAICAGNQIEVFSCSFGTKHVELCVTADEQNVTYRFGPKGAPELELTRGFDDIIVQPWNGIGRWIWEQVTLAKGQFSYALASSYDKFGQTVTGGLEVLRGDQVLASLDCAEGGNEGAFELETLSMIMSEAGYCRNDTNDSLSMGPCE